MDTHGPIPSVPGVDDPKIVAPPVDMPGPGAVWRPPALYAGTPRRHPWEIPALVIGILMAIGVYALIILLVMLTGISWLYLSVLALPFLIFFGRGLNYATMRVNAVQLSPTQYPDGYRMLVEAAARYGLEYVPDGYVLSGNGAINAFASGHGFRRYVVIYSDLFEIGGRARSPEALEFVIGHEVGHIAAGHVSYWRQLLSSTMMGIPVLGSLLSRAQEYTADNYGYYTRPDGAHAAIGVLSGGKYLLGALDFDQFADRATHEKGFFIFVANALSSHPVLTWRAAALRNRTRAGSILLRPKEFVRGSGSGQVVPIPAPPAPAQVIPGTLPNRLDQTQIY